MLLYTVGDSFTYGQELADPDQQAWPRLLANRLGYQLVNDGRPGTGTEFAVKRTMQAVASLQPDLVVVGWTSCGRTEYADAGGVYDIWPGCTRRRRHVHSAPHRQDLIKYITLYNNQLHEYRRWLRQIILLQSFLSCYNISYLFASAFDNQVLNSKYQNHNQKYWDMIDTTRFVGWPDQGFAEWAYGTPQGPGGHPLEQGHQRIADKLYEAVCSTR